MCFNHLCVNQGRRRRQLPTVSATVHLICFPRFKKEKLMCQLLSVWLSAFIHGRESSGPLPICVGSRSSAVSCASCQSWFPLHHVMMPVGLICFMAIPNFPSMRTFLNVTPQFQTFTNTKLLITYYYLHLLIALLACQPFGMTANSFTHHQLTKRIVIKLIFFWLIELYIFFDH